MNETLVTYETAVLAKEKGFKEPCLNHYFEDGEFRENKLTGTNGYYGEDYLFEYDDFLENWNDKWLTKKNGNRCFGCSKSTGYLETYSAPTQSLLQKWLREEHKLFINITHKTHSQKFAYNITGAYVPYEPYLLSRIFSKFETYEAALEDALQEALKLIE